MDLLRDGPLPANRRFGLRLGVCVAALVALALAIGLSLQQVAQAEAPQIASGKPPVTEEPAVALDPVPVRIIEIPGDYPLPGPGERVVIPVPAGAIIRFVGIDPTEYQVALDGMDFILTREDEATFVLQGLLENLERRPARIELDGVSISAAALASQAVALSGEQATSLPTLEQAAGPGVGAQGGTELFGLVPVITWLLDGLDVFPEARAADPEPAGRVATPLLKQVQAQFRIARERETIAAGREFEEVLAVIVGFLEEQLAGGAGATADVLQAKAVHIEAQLEVKDAEFRHNLAVISHDEAFGDWLEDARFLDWEEAPTGDVDEIRASVAESEHGNALRNWRQRQYALETGALLESLHGLAVEVRDSYRQQFEVGQRALLDLLGAERVLYQTRVRQAQRMYDLKSAEAWLLAAEGKLLPRYRQRPGSQP